MENISKSVAYKVMKKKKTILKWIWGAEVGIS